jgi:phage shock protein C
MIAGVCAGFAELYGWDLSLVRFATVMLTLVTGGIVLLAYVALWIILPEAPYTLPNTTGMPTA